MMYIREVYPTKEFRAQAKYYVFVEIDTDHNKADASKFGVGGIPDIRFLTKDGEEVHKVVGFKGMAILEDMNRARSMANR